MLKELEQLLQEIAQQQAGPSTAERPQPQRQPPAKSPSLVDAEIVYAEPVHESVDARVRQDIDTTDVTRHAARLGAELGQTDERMEAHLHQQFDHDLSEIDDQESVWDEAELRGERTTLASEIAAMLQDPTSVRQAVILNEVLPRPEHRW